MQKRIILPGWTENPYNRACRVCGALFSNESRWIRHVTECSEEHAERLHKANPRHDPFFSEVGDKELEQWVADHRTAIAQGRKRI